MLAAYQILTTVSATVWDPFMMVLLIGTGIFLTFRLRGIQVRKLVYTLRLMLERKEEGSGDISPFRALMTTLSGTIGTGNIAGVATAISLGGPGAIFWMWLTAIVGMATKFAECTLSLHFRKKLPDGTMIGGPFYYLERGLKNPRLGLVLGMAFAAAGAFSSVGGANMAQANSVAIALKDTFHIQGIVTRLSHKTQDITKFAPRVVTRLVKTLSKILRNIPKTPPPNAISLRNRAPEPNLVIASTVRRRLPSDSQTAYNELRKPKSTIVKN